MYANTVPNLFYNWIISLPMMVCFFWAIFFIVRFHRGNDEPRLMVTILLFYIASTILYTDHWLYFSDHPSFIGEWSYMIVNLCVYPLYFAYLRALTRTRINYEVPLLLLPAALITLFFPINTHFGWIASDIVLLCTRACFALQVIWVWVRGFRLLQSTQQRLDNTYTDYRSHLLNPTRLLLILIGITAVVSTLLNILGRERFDGSLLVGIPAVIMSILLFSLGYIAAHTILPKETVAQEEETVVDHATTAETDELFIKITTALREQRLFTNPNLTIQDLATAVGSNRTYVSNCINRRTGFSFSRYVAQYRVEHAQTILIDPQYISDHEAIADAIALSGFASDQTFYRIFKEVTGYTPLQFRQLNLQK